MGNVFYLVIINCCALIVEKGDTIKETYEKLDSIWDITPNCSVKIVLGDFNTKIRKEIMLIVPVF